METQKIVDFLNNLGNKDSKFATTKWSVIDNEKKGDYSHEFSTGSLNSILCDYSDTYILVRGSIAITRTVAAAGNNPLRWNQTLHAATQVALKKCAPFINCRAEINDTFVDEADFINVAMPMYDFIYYSDNYFDTSGSLWSFKRDEIVNIANVSNDNDASSFKYKASLTVADGKVDGAKIALPSKYLCNLWRSLEMPLIHWKVELSLTWINNYVLTTAVIRADANAAGADSATLKITDVKL